MSFQFDEYDLNILTELQRHGRLTNSELSARVFLSPSQCLRRVRRLEQSGVIRAYSALLEPGAVGIGIQAFVQVTLGKHGKDPARSFAEAIRDWEEVLGCWAITGDTDYLMRVVAPDLPDFSDLVLKRLLSLPSVVSVKSSILLEELKGTTILPLKHCRSNK